MSKSTLISSDPGVIVPSVPPKPKFEIFLLTTAFIVITVLLIEKLSEPMIGQIQGREAEER